MVFWFRTFRVGRSFCPSTPAHPNNDVQSLTAVSLHSSRIFTKQNYKLLVNRELFVALCLHYPFFTYNKVTNQVLVRLFIRDSDRERGFIKMANEFNTVEEALTTLQNGGFIILSDNEDRENEGDLVALADRFAFVDRGGPGEVAVHFELPIFGQIYIQRSLHFDTVGVYLLDVARLPESLERRQPDDPVVDVGVEPGRFAVERVFSLLTDGKFDAAVVGESRFLFQVGIAAGQEILVVERRVAVVS